MSEQVIQYAAYYLSDSGLSIKQISNELSLPQKTIKEILSNRKPQQNENIPTTSSKVNSKDMMIRETSVKGTKSVAIMTKAASEVNDEFKKQFNQTISRTAKNSIYRPNKNK